MAENCGKAAEQGRSHTLTGRLAVFLSAFLSATSS